MVIASHATGRAVASYVMNTTAKRTLLEPFAMAIFAKVES